MHATRIRLLVRSFGAVLVLALGLALGTMVTTGAEAPGDPKDAEPCGSEIALSEFERTGIEWSSSRGLPGRPY